MIKPKAALPTDPCQLLAMANDAMFRLNTGTAVVAIETPQLGRVEYNKADTDQLQRLIDGLSAQCAAQSGGQVKSTARKPISFEAWP